MNKFPEHTEENIRNQLVKLRLVQKLRKSATVAAAEDLEVAAIAKDMIAAGDRDFLEAFSNVRTFILVRLDLILRCQGLKRAIAIRGSHSADGADDCDEDLSGTSQEIGSFVRLSRLRCLNFVLF